MGRLLMLALLGVLSGCRAPMPTFNTITPYDASRVPPPGTQSYGTPAQTPNNNTNYPGANEIPPGPLPGVSVGVRPTSATADIERGALQRGSTELQWQRAAGGTATGLGSSPSDASRSSRSPGLGAGSRPDSAPASTTSASPEAPIRVVEGTAVPQEPPELRGMPVNDVSREPARFEPQGQLLDISQLPGR